MLFDNDFFDKGSKPQELVYLLSKPNIIKIFHYARFDLAMIKKYLGLDLKNLFCTKVSSKLVRTYTDKHGLKDLCKELINIDLNKSSQSSDWSVRSPNLLVPFFKYVLLKSFCDPFGTAQV